MEDYNERRKFDMSHYSFQAGNIGRLQTLSLMPVLAGESWELQLDGIMRLSPLRRNLTLDAMIDFFLFYIPHRHIYGEDWENFILEGVDENITFPTGPSVTLANQPQYLGQPINCWTPGNNIPLWIIGGYNQIWNRYFRNPSDDASILGLSDLAPGNFGQAYGQVCCYPKHIGTVGINPTDRPSGDDRLVNVTANQFDIVDLENVRARYETEIDRAWFGHRYNDILGKTWQSSVNIDADQRPELLLRKTEWLSGYDVDGTSDATLGSYSGKSASVVNLTMPRKKFDEHGALWAMALVRFPYIHEVECHYLSRLPQPTYLDISGDDALYRAQEPVEYELDQIYGANNSNLSLGMQPFGNHYRMQPNAVHARYSLLDGFPFLRALPINLTDSWYYQDDEYARVFQSNQLGEWQTQTRILANKYSNLPHATESIYAGANH